MKAKHALQRKLNESVVQILAGVQALEVTSGDIHGTSTRRGINEDSKVSMSPASEDWAQPWTLTFHPGRVRVMPWHSLRELTWLYALAQLSLRWKRVACMHNELMGYTVTMNPHVIGRGLTVLREFDPEFGFAGLLRLTSFSGSSAASSAL